MITNKFKIGNIVKGINRQDPYYSRIGKIVDIESDDSSWLVEFSEDISGHDGLGKTKSGKKYEDGHCWYFSEKGLERTYSNLDLYLNSKGIEDVSKD